MSAFRGILTGFGMAAIKNKEAKDNAKMEVVKAAGLDYVTNQLPEHKKREANRASAYKQLAKILDSEEAVDFLDANRFLVGDGKDVERTLKMLENKKIKPDAFKNYIPTSNYSDRYNQRQTDFNSRFSDVTKNFNIQGSGIGPSVVKGLLTQEEGDMTRTEEVTTPAVEPQQIEGTPIMTSGTPERTETITTEIPRTTADTPMSEFFTDLLPSGKMEPQFRLRMNDATRVALDSMGLSGKYNVGADGTLNITNFDEADNAKYGYAAELVNQQFLKQNFNPDAFQSVGASVGTYIEDYEKTIVNAHKIYSKALFKSPASVQPQGDAAYNIFTDTPGMPDLLMRYARGSRAERKLIEAKFGKSYSASAFFARYLDELAQE